MHWIRKHWFLVTLILMLVAGFQLAAAVESIVRLEWIKWTIVSVTMFLMAWPLSFGSLTQTIYRPAAALLACAMNVVAIPLLVWPLAALAGPELGPGMLVAAATPCTLASAAVWTRRAGGNDSVAIMVTILTNGSCFLVMPFWLNLQTGSSIESGLLLGTVYKLFLFVVLPIAIAQLARIDRPSANWATSRKPLLSTLALVGILCMVFIGSANMSLRLAGSPNLLTFQAIATATLMLTAVHCVVFWAGIWIAGLIRIPQEDRIAVGFAGSQKTLMIGLGVAISLGLSIIPIIAYHAVQLIVDTVFADRIRQGRER